MSFLIWKGLIHIHHADIILVVGFVWGSRNMLRETEGARENERTRAKVSVDRYGPKPPGGRNGHQNQNTGRLSQRLSLLVVSLNITREVHYLFYVVGKDCLGMLSFPQNRNLFQ